jgi:MFS family permease
MSQYAEAPIAMPDTVVERHPPSKEVSKSWLVAVGAMLGIAVGLNPIPTYTIGMFAPELSGAFGWTFASMMIALSIQSAVIVVVSPIAGQLVDRFGARPVAMISLLLFGLSYMSLGLISGSIWMFYVQWMVMSVVGAGTLSGTWTYVVNGWFDRNRGLALGLASAGTGLTGIVIKPLTAWLILTFDWRMSFFIIGLIPIVIGIPMVAALFHERKQDETDEADNANMILAGYTVREAMRQRQFWLMAIAFLLISIAITSPTPNMENILKSLHFDLITIGHITGVFGLAVIVGRLGGGWLLDRIWAPLCVLMVFLPWIFASWLLSQPIVSEGRAFASVAALGLAAGLEFDALAYLVARYFGRRNYGTIYGLIFSMLVIGGGIGPVAYGYAFDTLNSYSLALRLGSIVLLIGSGLLLLLGSYPERFDKHEPA